MSQIKRDTLNTIAEVFCRNIGVESLSDVNEWFKKSYANKYCIKKLGEVASFVQMYKEVPVRIIGDYDVDGVMSCYILQTTLAWLGFKDVTVRIPKRFSEGFGISLAIVEEVNEGLIITCDNGIAQLEAITKAKEKGLDVVIIDHHLPVTDKEGNVMMPDADYIIDPNAVADSADFNGYCGAGLCYKFACEMLGYNKAYTQRLLGPAAIATVCDVMELREENYVIVRNGLKALLRPNLNTTGLYALLSAFQLTKHISAHDIGFKIGPAINACSRMKDEGAMDALGLISYNGPYSVAVAMAENVVSVNDARKVSKKDAIKMAEDIILENCFYGDVPLVVYIPGISEGLIGIVAGNLAEKYEVPAFVLTDAEADGEVKGSARSAGNYHVEKEMKRCSELFIKFGGHEGAGGMTLKKENIDALRIALQKNCADFEYEKENMNVYFDLEIPAKDIPKTLEELEKYEPFGEGNPPIVFKVSDFSVVPFAGVYKKLIGSDLSIVKMYSTNATAVGFDMAEPMHNVKNPERLDLVGTLSMNYFNGKIESQIEFTDFVVKEAPKVVTPMAAKLQKMAASLSDS